MKRPACAIVTKGPKAKETKSDCSADAKSLEPAAILRKTVATFDFGANHKYQCENGGKFRSYYKTDDGQLLFMSNKQAHKQGLSWSTHGVYSCCEEARANITYSFEQEPQNRFDTKAVKIIGKDTGDHLGYVPREYNEFVGMLLNNKKLKVLGERVCGHILEIHCVVEGPISELERYHSEKVDEDDDSQE